MNELKRPYLIFNNYLSNYFISGDNFIRKEEALRHSDLISVFDLGDERDVTRDGEIMGGGVLAILWVNAEVVVFGFLPL